MKGNKTHEARVPKRASGGGITQKGPHQEQTNAKKTEKMEHPKEYKGRNRAEREVKVEKAGGGAVARKSGGRVPGATSAARLDKKGRSGNSAKSPLSGADAPNLSYAKSNLKTDDGGKGKSIK